MRSNEGKYKLPQTTFFGSDHRGSLGYSSKLDPMIVAKVDLAGMIEPGKHILITAIDTLVGNDAVALRFAPNIWEPKYVHIGTISVHK